MSDDRLVVCPECDELVVEDEWDDHQRACRPVRLYEMAPNQLLHELDRRSRADRYWHDSIRRREEVIKDACERYDADGFKHGVYTFPFWQPNAQLYEYGIPASAVISRDARRDYSTIHTIRINVPLFPLEPGMAYAIIREQIEQQWREYSEEPF